MSTVKKKLCGAPVPNLMGSPCERVGSAKYGGRCYQHRKPTDADLASAKERRMRRYAIDEAQHIYNLTAGTLLEAKERVVKLAEAYVDAVASNVMAIKRAQLKDAVGNLKNARRELEHRKKQLESLPRPETKG